MLLSTLHKRTQQLDYWDLKMLSVSMVVLGLLLGRLIPELTDVNPWWWGGISLLLLVRPLYRFWRPNH